MKLIDKDSLMEIMNCNKPLADGYHMKDYVFDQIMHDIDNEPTIEAIPISWIEEWCKYLRENIKNVSYKNLNVYREVYEDYLKMERFLSMMIEDWRKENGQSND